MKKVKLMFSFILVFLAGLLAGMQMILLVDMNPTYEAAWWKAGLACVITTVVILNEYKEKHD